LLEQTPAANVLLPFTASLALQDSTASANSHRGLSPISFAPLFEDHDLPVKTSVTPRLRKAARSAALNDGYRESKECWKELLLDREKRGLQAPPQLAVGHGAMGLWAALEAVFPQTRHQRCWFHKKLETSSTS
jgi:hypothetical protein